MVFQNLNKSPVQKRISGTIGISNFPTIGAGSKLKAFHLSVRYGAHYLSFLPNMGSFV
jgi:hypothetical protein